MENFEKKLEEYASLLVNVGLAVQKGQRFVIHAPVDSAAFARMCAKAGYAAGAKEVIVSYSDEELTRMRFLEAESSVFDSVAEWVKHMYNDYAEEGAAMLFIAASDPENLKGVDPDRIQRSSRAAGEALEVFRRLEMSNGFPWCVASIPIPSWAAKVFPEDGEEEAMAKLWDAIFSAVRVSGEGNAVARWRDHLAHLKARTDKLNALRFAKLHYKNSLGTDLWVELPPDHIWMSGEDTTPTGQKFVANMPTEEIFTAPLKTGINGKIVAALPLSLDGCLITDFSMEVEKGKIVSVCAKEGEEQLKNAITVDEGASYFGEVALIPYDSPIRNQGILYYETLFDENASCHFAFGEAYPCIEGGMEMSPEELTAHGLNQSITHVDFMVGTEDLSIVGYRASGEEIVVFENGNFTF